MRYFIIIFFFFLLNCRNEKNELKENDIVKITHESNGIVNNITENYYVLDKRFKEPGKHSLMMSKDEISLIKKVIINKKIYALDDSLKFVKYCEGKGCLSEIVIQYKSGRKQHFIFDNANYKDNFKNTAYKKIIYLEGRIGEIYRSKKIDPEPINVYL
ncbi:hypothetical protein [Chryseobacterium sp. KCF3-3]|uniref:hypothetical protein n=1 Tax=Chryseobacterium sp. KCF3-3 TaxID=3231511 RepID=UPI0038B26CD4